MTLFMGENKRINTLIFFIVIVRLVIIVNLEIEVGTDYEIEAC